MTSKTQILNRVTHVATQLANRQTVINNGVTKLNTDLTAFTASALASLGTIAGDSGKIPGIDQNVKDIQRYALMSSVGEAIGGTGEGIVRVIRAFSDKRYHDGAAELLRVLGSFCNALVFVKSVKWMGPVGSIIGELLGVVISLIDMFKPQEKSLEDVLRGELQRHMGLGYKDALEGLIDALHQHGANLIGRKPHSLGWDEVNDIGKLVETQTVMTIGASESYLDRERHNENDVWAEVFESHVLARTLLLENLLRATLLLRFDTDETTSELAPAVNVLAEVCAQYRTYIETIAPAMFERASLLYVKASRRGEIRMKVPKNDYHIGGRDTWGLQLATGADGQRVFFRGYDNRYIYTERGSDGARITHAGTDDVMHADEYAVVEISEDAYHVYVIDGGKLRYGRFPNADLPAPVINADDPDVDAKYQLLRITATTEQLYATAKEGAATKLLIIDPEGTRELRQPAGVVTERLSVSRSFLYLAGADQTLWRKAVVNIDVRDESGSEIVVAHRDWEHIEIPYAALKLDAAAEISDLFAAADGTVLLVIGGKTVQYADILREPWSLLDVPEGNLYVVKASIPGHQMFATMANMLERMERTTEQLGLANPLMMPQTAAAFSDVAFTQTAFSPQHVTVRVGGKVRWTWEGDHDYVLAAQHPRFSGSGRTFEQVFLVPGTITYKSSQGGFSGTIEVVHV